MNGVLEEISEMNDKNQLVMWQYFYDPNDINNAILQQDPNWEGLESAEQIISITYDSNHGCYVVFWRE